MKKFMKAVTLMLMALTMFLGTNVITANAQIMIPCGDMKVAEDGRIEIDMSLDCGHYAYVEDASGRQWDHAETGYPFCWYEEKIEIQKSKRVVITYRRYLDCYLTDYIRSHDESEWPSFVIKGSDGVPFYYCDCSPDYKNYDLSHNGRNHYFVKYCYDEKTGFWVWDKSYKGPYTWMDGTGYVETVTMEELIAQTKEDMANGKIVNGKPKTPAQPIFKDKLIDSETGEKVKPVTPDPVNPPTEGEEIKDPYADENTLGATVTIATDCIKVKTNKKGVVAQKPLPKSVKVGTKALKRNKTFVVSYEKYDDGWYETDAVREEGIYRLVITGQNGYEGVYKKRLYVTADKTIKAMSSAAVKVNKIPYSGEPITSGVIKTVKVGKRVLEEGADYIVTYKNNLDSGTGQVTLTAIEGSGILGTKTVNFTITGNKMNKVKVTGLKPLVYDPNAEMVQNMSDVQLTYAGNALTEGIDFTLAYVNNAKAGTAKMVFTGKGLYNGTLNKTFKITKLPLNDGMLDEASKNIKLSYTGKALKPEVKLTVGGTELKKGTDYTLSYSNNVKVSTETKPAWIVVKGKGNYSGSFKVSFTIEEKGDTTQQPKQIKNMSLTDDETETVSENDVVDDTDKSDVDQDADDTVSGNDIPDDSEESDEDQNTDDADKRDEDQNADDTVSENEVTDDTDKSNETETVSENDITDDTDNSAETETVSENSITDDDKEADEDQNAVDSVSENDISDDTGELGGVRVCWCGHELKIRNFNKLSAEEKAVWVKHVKHHIDNDEITSYTDRYRDGTKVEVLKAEISDDDSLLVLEGSDAEAHETEHSETDASETDEVKAEETTSKNKK